MLKKTLNKVRKCAAWALLLTTVGLGTTACDGDGPREGEIWDFAPYSVCIKVVDTNGADLLDPNNPDNILKDSITAEFEGKVYKVTSVTDHNTRFLPAEFRGLVCCKYYKEDYYLLVFGQFQTEDNAGKRSLTIDWKNGKEKDVITFSHSFKWKNHEPKQKTQYWLNGEEVSSPITFVRNN